ncbi:MAG: 30S ribosomal protein S7 [Firmicutes bacterium]|nr:30S ribosomal protein S7 [Bacillota bacterium]
MPRRGYVPKREIIPDPIYNSETVTRLINAMMLDGKRGTAEKIMYEALEIVREKAGRDPLEVLEEGLKNITPVLEVKARRVGGATYQVPVEVRPERRRSLSLRWLVQFARTRGERRMAERLAAEILDAANNQGGAVRRKEETHRMAEANRAFAHYRW